MPTEPPDPGLLPKIISTLKEQVPLLDSLASIDPIFADRARSLSTLIEQLEQDADTLPG
jgi:hypothetical protein